MYQPEIGRFLQPDPKEFLAGDYNLYRYCHNDPVNRTDPTGLEYYDNKQVTYVESLQGQLGRTTVTFNVVSIAGKDGTYTLQLDVTVLGREVATQAKFGGQMRHRSDAAIEATREHEVVEHGKDWKSWHDTNQVNVPKTKFDGLDSAKKAADAVKEKLKPDFKKANETFEKHEPKKRWEPILLRERS